MAANLHKYNKPAGFEIIDLVVGGINLQSVLKKSEIYYEYKESNQKTIDEEWVSHNKTK